MPTPPSLGAVRSDVMDTSSSAGADAVAPLLDMFARFGCDTLTAEWVQGVIDSDYTDTDPLPPRFTALHAQTNWPALLAETGSICRSFIRKQQAPSIDQSVTSSVAAEASGAPCASSDCTDSSATYLWTALSGSGLAHKNIVTLMFDFICSGQRFDCEFDDRQSGLLASSIYLNLLAIPGSNAFRIFHPQLYSRVLDTFQQARQLAATTRTAAAGQEDADEADQPPPLEPQQITRLTRLLNGLMADLLTLTERFSLRHAGADSLEETVQCLMDVSSMDLLVGSSTSSSSSSSHHGGSGDSLSALSHNAFCCLTNLCRPLHGSVQRSLGLVLHACLPSLLLRPPASGVGHSQLQQPTPSRLVAARDRTLQFIGQLVASVTAGGCPAAGLAVETGCLTLLQQLCVRVPERAECRQRAAQTVVALLQLASPTVRTKALRWLRRLARHERVTHRLQTLEILSRLLLERETRTGRPAASRERRRRGCQRRRSVEDSEGSDESEEEAVPAPADADPDVAGVFGDRALLVRLALSGCWDAAATVRSKALNVLAECTVSDEPTVRRAVAHILAGQQAENNRPRRPTDTEAAVGGEAAGDHASPEDDAEVDGIPASESIPAMLRRRAGDSKVMVRKSSIQVIENTMRISQECVTEDNLQVMLDHCRDSALLVRKQCQSSLIALVTLYPHDARVCEAAVRGLVPLIHDSEERVQQRVVEFVEQVILSGIRPWCDEDALTTTSSHDRLPWTLLDLVVKLCFQKYLFKIMQSVFSNQSVKPTVWSALQSHVGTVNNSASWMCLALVARFSRIRQPLFALDYFVDRIRADLQTEELLALQQCLTVLKCSTNQLSPSDRQRVTSEVTSLLGDVWLPCELIGAAVDTVAMTTLQGVTDGGATVGDDQSEYRSRLEEWCAPLIEECEDFLSKELLKLTRDVPDALERRIVRQIFTLGELAQLLPHRVNKRCFLMLQNLIYVEKDGGANGEPAVSSRMRAVAITSLGKLCLQHEQMAKRVIPALGKILDVADEEAIKNNVVFTLSDMCVRYATLVDPLMPQFTCCLKEPSLVVRRNTLILLIHLLQEDYLKLKGTFLYRILQCLTDHEAEIRQLISFYLTERLLKRHPKIFFQHFVESLFVYNEYDDHESYNRMGRSPREAQVFRCRGPENRVKRQYMYQFMLEYMPDDQRFQTSHRLCQDVLGGVVDGKVALSEAGTALLRDALAVLSCDEIKLQSLKCRPEDQDPAADVSAMAEVMQAMAKKTLISQVVKKNVIENMVPIVIALKHKLTSCRSPLLRELMVFLRDLMKDYKNEVQDILVADKQLAREIEFDMKRLQEERDAAAAAEDEGRQQQQHQDHDQGTPVTSRRPQRDHPRPSSQQMQDLMEAAMRTTTAPATTADSPTETSAGCQPERQDAPRRSASPVMPAAETEPKSSSFGESSPTNIGDAGGEGDAGIEEEPAEDRSPLRKRHSAAERPADVQQHHEVVEDPDDAASGKCSTAPEAASRDSAEGASQEPGAKTPERQHQLPQQEPVIEPAAASAAAGVVGDGSCPGTAVSGRSSRTGRQEALLRAASTPLPGDAFNVTFHEPDLSAIFPAEMGRRRQSPDGAPESRRRRRLQLSSIEDEGDMQVE